MSQVKSIIERILQEGCNLRVISYHIIPTPRIDVIKIRVHFNDMRFCDSTDHQILERLRVELPGIISVTCNHNDHIGNQFHIIIDKGELVYE